MTKDHPQNFFLRKSIEKMKSLSIKPDPDGNILMSRFGFHDPIKSFWVGGKPLGSNHIAVDVAVKPPFNLDETSVGGGQ